jgi:hypothetical protein
MASRPRRAYSWASVLMIRSDKSRFCVCLCDYVMEIKQDCKRAKKVCGNMTYAFKTLLMQHTLLLKYTFCPITARSFCWRDLNCSANLVLLIYSTLSNSVLGNNLCVCVRGCFTFVRGALLQRQCVTAYLFDRV